MNILTKLFLTLRGCKVGKDKFGNTYYEINRLNQKLRSKRYVIYKGVAEASKIPSDWHGWLHHTDKSPPPLNGYDKYSWELEHLPNLTGTKYAYRPSGHFLKKDKRKNSTGDYNSWDPNQKT